MTIASPWGAPKKRKAAPKKKAKAPARKKRKAAPKKATPKKKAKAPARKKRKTKTSKASKRKFDGCPKTGAIYPVPDEWIDWGGKVSKAYIAADLSKKKKDAILAVKPFEWDGQLWVVVSGFYGGSAQPFTVNKGTSLTPRSKWKGKTFKNRPTAMGTNYKGLQVKVKGKPYVLTGKVACFVPESQA
ncbi:MAG: hypothetical protein ACYTFN_24195 [Planctomycetota bacterium]